MFIDAPHILRPADIPGSAPQMSETGLNATEASIFDSDPSAAPRAWWKVNEDKTIAYGLRESVEAIRDLLHGRKFDLNDPPPSCSSTRFTEDVFTNTLDLSSCTMTSFLPITCSVGVEYWLSKSGSQKGSRRRNPDAATQNLLDK